MPLYESLMTNTSIEKLYLDYNDLRGKDIYWWEDILIKNRSIKTLSLAGWYLGDEGTIIIWEALILNNSVTELNLKKNEITDFSAKALLALMKMSTRPQIRKLNLSKNTLTHKFGEPLVEIVLGFTKYPWDVRLEENHMNSRCEGLLLLFSSKNKKDPSLEDLKLK